MIAQETSLHLDHARKFGYRQPGARCEIAIVSGREVEMLLVPGYTGNGIQSSALERRLQVAGVCTGKRDGAGKGLTAL